MVRKLSAGLTAVLFLVAAIAVMAADPAPSDMRKQANTAQQKGNFKDALTTYQKLLDDAGADKALVSRDLVNAVQCLQRLGREDEIDKLVEKAIKTHAENWKLLETAAQQYQNLNHQGTIVAGEFYRGYRRSNDGKQVFSFERDRIRALQLMQDAMTRALADNDKKQVAEFFFRFADMLHDRRFGGGSWQMQYASDLSKLPDYDEGYPAYYYGRGNNRGAPVDAEGKPVFHTLPKSWEAATTDGQRWRWCLMQASEFNAEVADRARLVFATFLREQFDVQTMLDGGYSGRRGFSPRPATGVPGVPGADSDDDTRKDETGPFAVSSLTEGETIARLANGIKRFKLPDEFNFLSILKDLGEKAKAPEGESALNLLAQVFEDRQQLTRAAEFWIKSIAKYGKGSNNWKQQRLDQIVNNWGEYDQEGTNPAGTEPTLGYLFRNGKKVTFTAQSLDVIKVLDDVKAYIKTRPAQLAYEKVNINDIGYRIVVENQNQYVQKEVARWDVDLKPRENHRDRRIYTKMPVKDAGAYLVTAKMENGNTTRVVVWVADTAIVKKQLDGGTYLFVADAVTGSPLPKTNVSFFGYQQIWRGNDGKKYEININEFAENTDADGQVVISQEKMQPGFGWLIQANGEKGRHAFIGFTNIWGGSRAYDYEYNMNKAFTVTDRPVYRPEQTVKFKTWIGQAKYDAEGKNAYADKNIAIQVLDPRGEKLIEKTYTTDQFGGFEGEIPLAKGATLGNYAIQIVNYPDIQAYGGNTFRVEEYKKPEFEVKVDAPTEPIMLGEKITATIKANYYFGAPVANAKVKYKVMRSSYRADWYPAGRWDWFYEPGYWWFGHDYHWYKGFGEWGCFAPTPRWFNRSYQQPELVMENEIQISQDGTVKVEIDTAPAKELHGYTDHKYEITAEVVDESRRTIVGTGSVSVARKPFKVYAWVNNGFFQENQVIQAEFSAQTLDNKPVKGKGELKLLSVKYDEKKQPVEKEVQSWQIDTNDEGRATHQLKAAEPGQYRLSYKVTDNKGHQIEGGYVFVVRGPGFDGKDFRFNDIELTPNKKEYAAGDTMQLMVNTERANSTVLLFDRASNGVYLKPKVLRLDGKSTLYETAIGKKEMPNFFVEAVTVGGGNVYIATKEIVVPPESRVTNISVKTSQERYRPGEKAQVTFTLTDAEGKPVVGTAVVSMYDKSVEYISGGSNTPDIRKFFWEWRRHHYPRTESSLGKASGPLHKRNEIALQLIGRFGFMSADLPQSGEELAELEGVETQSLAQREDEGGGFGGGRGGGARLRGAVMDAAPMAAAAPMAPGQAMPMEKASFKGEARRSLDGVERKQAGDKSGGAGPDVAPDIRTNFADTALWATTVNTNDKGEAKVELTMPENLTTWKTKVWSLSQGTRVGQGDTEVTTYKDLIIRLQAPRFFVQKDEVVLSANVHNYLKTTKDVKVELVLQGGTLEGLAVADSVSKSNPGGNGLHYVTTVRIEPNGEKRVDWRVKVLKPGQATVRMLATTDEESDATEQKFPVFIHGMLKTDSFSGAIRPAEQSSSLTFRIPAERLPDQTRVEIRYSPTLAGAMVDALPYLVDFPYGCTEQTLNRFLPTVITQRVLLNMGLDLKDIQQKRTNLNAQEIGDDAKRAVDWKRNNPAGVDAKGNALKERNPVFDIETVQAMTKEGVNRLTNMQNADGGWGWFSGSGEQSWPHTTAQVVHGLQIARDNDVALVPGVLERGIEWLKRYEATQVQYIKNFDRKVSPAKQHADNLDAMVYMVLADANLQNGEMRDFIYRDRNFIAVQCKAMYGLAMHKQGHKDKLDMILQNISQYVVKDGENQSAFLRMPPEGNYWWCWYGNDIEAHSWYLKLLSRTDAKADLPSQLAKYIINNRKHASYWGSTRETGTAIEALAEFIKASGEDSPNLTVTVLVDGVKTKEVKIDKTNLFSFDNKVVLGGPEVKDGEHKVEIRKTGTGPIYYNAYVTNFTLEDPITKAGLEVKVQRKFYKLVSVKKTIKVEGGRGQALDQRVEKFERQELKDGDVLVSGDLVEVEMEIDSKNDYEYLIFEDMKAAGFEPVEVRSGYNGNDLNAYVEFRDERVAFFARTLARGKHSVSYKLRAEIPGKFSALPTKASAMYAPELKANSDEGKLSIVDAPKAVEAPR
ncbi:alpha-2-macroglobulin [Humisphaera borealis]|uniref:Alpha-2-macroglobulin n=2 Tax=Humisphaera borealis TaxID=2807512 RepID=A0A7M2X3X3_9BACT|nr:alpha-2-macroglobulin [Humisphaera borealis]